MLLSILLLLGMVGTWQIVLVVVVILLLFGGKKIPELMRGLGSGMKEFKDATRDDSESTKDTNKTEDKSSQAKSNQ
jgi:sec-independent protein translocase protein TatA